jgi:hypothetical protein
MNTKECSECAYHHIYFEEKPCSLCFRLDQGEHDYWTPKDPNITDATELSPDRSYYDMGGISTLHIIKAKLTSEQYEGFLLGNIIKYSSRLNWKGCKRSDADKLADYSRWLKELQDV